MSMKSMKLRLTECSNLPVSETPNSVSADVSRTFYWQIGSRLSPLALPRKLEVDRFSYGYPNKKRLELSLQAFFIVRNGPRTL